VTLEEEITNLTAKWYKYVSLDHHKDRDCHWHIEKTWSYGEEPYYQAYHNGYIINNWVSPKCDTAEMAMTILRDKLKNEIKSAIVALEDMVGNQDALDWVNKKEEEVKNIIKEIQ